MAAAKWQQANGAKKVRKSAKTDGQKRPETGSPKKCEHERKSAKTVENKRKRAKTIAEDFVDRFLAIFQWPFCGGHFAVAI